MKLIDWKPLIQKLEEKKAKQALARDKWKKATKAVTVKSLDERLKAIEELLYKN